MRRPWTALGRSATGGGGGGECLLMSPILNGIEIMRQCLVDIPELDLRENPSCECLVVNCGQTDLTGGSDVYSSRFFCRSFSFTNSEMFLVKCSGRMWTALIWLVTGFSCRLLQTR